MSLISRRQWLRAASVALAAGTLRGQSAEVALQRPPPELKHVNLAGNENPFGPSPAVVQRIVRAAPDSCRYPFREEQVLKELLAQKEGVPLDHIVLGNGADEILALCAAAWLGPGTALVATDPTYFQLPDHARHREAEVRWVAPAEDMRHDLAGLAAAVNANTRVVYVCNPDNPSGTFLPRSQLEPFCREVAQRSVLVIDEVYLDLLDDAAEQTQVSLVREGLSVVVVRSFSKLYGLAGHRIGYAIAPPALAAALQKRQMSSVNYLGVAAAQESLFDRAFHAWSLRKIREGRASFTRLLDELGLRYTPSVGNFVFHEVGRPVELYQERMKEHGFLVNWPHAPSTRYPTWCRTSIGTDVEMRAHAAAMRAIVQAA